MTAEDVIFKISEKTFCCAYECDEYLFRLIFNRYNKYNKIRVTAEQGERYYYVSNTDLGSLHQAYNQYKQQKNQQEQTAKCGR